MKDDLTSLARAGLTFNAPLSDERARVLVHDLGPAPGRHVLDLACGSAELLLRIVAAHPAVTGTGVDTDRAALDRGRQEVARRGLHHRVELVEGDARSFRDRGDLVLCVGAEHVWGGAVPALGALSSHLDPGGLLLFGAGFWEREPAPEVRAVFGDLPRWENLLAAAREAGFDVVAAERSTRAEWDAFEAAWRSGLEASDDEEARAFAARRKREYREGYRGVLGFAWLVLVRRP
jgi:cyclopropane fatty-acyl-phospholipid synthase-like methyltransferase